jgi:hypothetical protein
VAGHRFHQVVFALDLLEGEHAVGMIHRLLPLLHIINGDPQLNSFSDRMMRILHQAGCKDLQQKILLSYYAVAMSQLLYTE